MYEIKRTHYNRAGFIPKSVRSTLSPFDQVIAYIKAWDKTHAYKYCITNGQIRTRLIGNFLKEHLGYDLSKLPPIENQMLLIFEHFATFKKLLNQKHKDDTLKDWI